VKLFIQLLFNGLGQAGTILLVSISLMTVLSSLRVINVTIGASITVTAMLAIWAGDHFGIAGVVAACLVIPPLLYVVIELLVLGPQRHRLEDAEMGSFAATLGISIVFSSIAALLTGAAAVALAANLLRFSALASLGDIQFDVLPLIVLVLSLGFAGIWGAILALTPVGKLYRALAADPELAGAIGARVRLISIQSWVISGLFTGVATLLLIVQLRALDANAGGSFLLTPFAAVIAGGLGSLRGMIFTSFFFGLGQSLLAGLTGSPSLQQVFVFSALFLVLFIKPNGLFPRPDAIRSF
jgi:branched-subunit amino acid ABC-type transport system permease component